MEELINEEVDNSHKVDVSSKVCPLCKSVNYEEHEELMYKNGTDDPQYGGELINVKISDCRDCG